MANPLSKQNSAEYALVTLKNFVSQLSITVTPATIEKFRYYNTNPSLASFSEVLDEWHVDNICTKLDYNQLKEIPYPAIAHLSQNNGHFIVLIGIQGEIVEYLDPAIGKVKESSKEFATKWTGFVLLAQKNERSGEQDYERKRREDKYRNFSRRLAWILIVGLLLYPILLIVLHGVASYSIKIVGLWLCLLAMQKQFGSQSAIGDAICRTGRKRDCEAVIHSPSSKIFGFFYLSELGAWYFSGGALAIVTSGHYLQETRIVLAIFSLVAVFISVRAIYIQHQVVKMWCPLCLAIIGVIWCDFVISAIYTDVQYVSLNSLAILLVSFAVPLCLWLSVRERLIDSSKLFQLEGRLRRFLNNEDVFKALLEAQPLTNIARFANEIFVGPNNARVTLTVVSNPSCKACAYTHLVIEDLISCFKENIKVMFRFSLGQQANDSVAHEMVSQVIRLNMHYSSRVVLQALSSWYLKNGERDVTAWKRGCPALPELPSEVVHDAVLENFRWCKKIGIISTPTILIDGKILPHEFQMTDLKYHIKKLLDARELTESQMLC